MLVLAQEIPPLAGDPSRSPNQLGTQTCWMQKFSDVPGSRNLDPVPGSCAPLIPSTALGASLQPHS